MRAELIAVGSELLRPGRRENNTEWLLERLEQAGIAVSMRSMVEDDAQRIASLVRGAIDRAELLLLTGGLGPTEDDRTRDGLALALGEPLVRDEACERELRERFERHGLPFTSERARQADRPPSATGIDNRLGSAPGLAISRNGSWIVALPGVPAEMKAMFTSFVEPRLAELAPGTLATRTLKVCGRTESSLDRQLRDLYGTPGVEATLLGGTEGLELILRAEGRDLSAARAALDGLEARMIERLGDDLLGVGPVSLPAVVGDLLLRAGRTIATVESCTAGLLGAALTEVPGSSAWYRGGIVVYHDDLKRGLAGVSRETLARHGAVSEEVARELARGGMERCAADGCIGITGIAGPGGGSEEKPVGTVHIALQYGRQSLHRSHRLVGDRESVRRRAVSTALDRLRRRLLEQA